MLVTMVYCLLHQWLDISLFIRNTDGIETTVPRTTTKFGDRAFSVAGPVMWNSLPAAVRHANSLHSF